MTEDQTTYPDRVIAIGPSRWPLPEHTCRLEERPGVAVADLLANAVRMRPDVIRIGRYELRHVCRAGLWGIFELSDSVPGSDLPYYSTTAASWVPTDRLQTALVKVYAGSQS